MFPLFFLAHSEERKFACTYCDFKAKISVVLKRHIKRLHHNELNFVCDICGKKFFEAYRLKIHEETHVKEKKRKTAHLEVQNEICDICQQPFLGKQALSVHKSVSHDIHEPINEKKKSITCDKCGKSFTSPKYLYDHCNQEHPTVEKIASIEAKCHNCHIDFYQAHTLNNHLVSCLMKDEVKQFKCEKCTENLSLGTVGSTSEIWHSSTALRKHIAESHNLILTICEICGALLKSKYYLEDHKKSVHEKVKNFACNYCGKVFASKSTLNGHVGRMHETISRKFKCDKCEFTSLEPNKLKIHEQAIHQKSVRYECHLCKYFSYRKTGLQNHIKVVHEKYRPHQCDVCEMTFTYKRDKLKHMLKHQASTT